MDRDQKVQDLLAVVECGIDAVKPSRLFSDLNASLSIPEVARWIKSDSRFLLCLGKAAVSSAEAILDKFPVSDYFVLAPYSSTTRLKVNRGSHPVPDQRSLASTKLLQKWMRKLPVTAELLVVLSGGSSALLFSPQEGVEPTSKIRLNQELIRSGATIQEVNTVRKHLSAVKGGRLAAEVADRKCVALVISDVPGNDLSSIGSGPLFPDPTTYSDAIEILKRYRLWSETPADVQKLLEGGASGKIPETPKPGAFDLPHYIIASNEIAQNAAAAKAEALGYNVLMFRSLLTGNIYEAAESIKEAIEKSNRRTALIAGGEVTLQVKGNGIGGRNQHLALLLTERLAGSDAVFLAAGTDGIDGNSPAAGAWTDGTTYRRSGETALMRCKKEFDSFHYFEALGQTLNTGPTGTNVMDLYIALL